MNTDQRAHKQERDRMSREELADALDRAEADMAALKDALDEALDAWAESSGMNAETEARIAELRKLTVGT